MTAELTNEQRAAIEQAVQAVLDEQFDAVRQVDFDRTLPLCNKSFFAVNVGVSLPSLSAVEAVFRPGWAQIEKQDINIKETKIVVLAPNVASAIVFADFTSYYKAGTTFSSASAMTFILVKEGEDWKFVHLHQSMPLPQQD